MIIKALAIVNMFIIFYILFGFAFYPETFGYRIIGPIIRGAVY